MLARRVPPSTSSRSAWTRHGRASPPRALSTTSSVRSTACLYRETELRSKKQAEVRGRLWCLPRAVVVRADMASHGQVQVQQKIAYGDIRMRLVSAAA